MAEISAKVCVIVNTRRSTPSNANDRVGIVWKRWRRVDWKETESFKHVSIWDNYMNPGAPSLLQFDLTKYRAIILSWDVANGDPAFGSDITLNYLHHRRAKMWQWVYDGGVLIIENQTDGFQPIQAVYDSLLGDGEVIVEAPYPILRERSKLAGRGGKQFESLNPILEDLDEDNDLCPRPGLSESFSKGSVDEKVEDIDIPIKNIHAGWFKRWKNEWEPLIKCKGQNKPIMLARKFGKGMIFATTMYLGASNWNEKIQHFLEKDNFYQDVRDYNTPLSISLWRRILPDGLAILSGAVVGLFAVVTLRFNIISTVLLPIITTIIAFVVRRLSSYLLKSKKASALSLSAAERSNK